jgi:chitinase
MARRIVTRLTGVVVVALLLSLGLVTPADAAPCASQRDGLWTGVWASSNPANGGGAWVGDLAFFESSVSGSVSLTGSVFFGGALTGSVSCSSITFGTVGGEITFQGTLAPDGLSASGTYSVIFGDTGTWSGSLTTPDPPAISVGSASVQEGNSGTRSVEVPVTLSRPSISTVRVSYATSAAGAGAADYVDRSGTVTFSPGASGLTPVTKWIKVPIGPDVTVEDPVEDFVVTLSNPVGATINNATGGGFILDDDATAGPVVSIAASLIYEGDEAKRVVRLNLWLSQPAAVPVEVEFSTGDDTAVAPADYRPKSDELTFKPGQVRKAISVPIVADNLAEPGFELFNGFVLSAVGAPIAHDQATFIIVDE